MDSKILEKRKQLIAMRKKIEDFSLQEKILAGDLQNGCDHGSVVEKDFEQEEIGDGYRPPIRLCIICGLQQTAHDDGEKILFKKVILKKVSPDKFYEYSRKLPQLKEALVPVR